MAAKKKKTKKKKVYHKYVLEKKNVLINVILSNRELGNLKRQLRKNEFLNVEDYIISLIECNYDNYINANDALTIKTDITKYDSNEHDLKVHKLHNQTLLKHKNDKKDTEQITLDKYF